VAARAIDPQAAPAPLAAARPLRTAHCSPLHCTELHCTALHTG
jgi:hypothetical protein